MRYPDQGRAGSDRPPSGELRRYDRDRRHDAGVLALYCDALDALDALGHAEGDESPSMPATLASLDTQLGRLVQGLKDADLYDDTTFILTGDHGMRHFTHGFG